MNAGLVVVTPERTRGAVPLFVSVMTSVRFDPTVTDPKFTDVGCAAIEATEIEKFASLLSIGLLSETSLMRTRA